MCALSGNCLEFVPKPQTPTPQKAKPKTLKTLNPKTQNRNS